MANDQDLILLNATSKNGRAYSGQIAVDVCDITNPIPDGGGSPLVVYVKNSIVSTLGDANNVDAWTVSDSLSTIANQDLNLAIVPITKIESRGTQHPTTYSSPKNILFYLPNIVGAAEDVATGGCSFLYNIQGDPIPVKYYSNLTVSQLVSSAPIGGITSVNGNTGPAVTLTVVSTAVGQSLTWSGTTLQMPTAGATTAHGLLSSSDWTTFSNKIGGSGTANKVAKFTASGTIGNGLITDDGTSVYNLGTGAVAGNTVFGLAALAANTTGAENTAFGNSALNAVTTGGMNTAFGHDALLKVTGSNNTGLGADVLRNMVASGNNTAIGFQAGYSATSGDYNVYIGQSAGYSEASTTGAVIIGANHDNGFFSADGNIKIGIGTWTNAVHDIANNIAIGNQASRDNHANDVVAIGGGANAYNSTGTAIVAIGTGAGGANNWGTPYVANHVTAIGHHSLWANTGDGNTALGYLSGVANTAGTLNTFIGAGADAAAGTYTNATAIGAGAVVGASNTMVLGNAVRVAIGASTAATSAILDLTSTTGALLVPRMDSTAEGALTAVNGMIIYNSQTNKFRGYENGAWADLI